MSRSSSAEFSTPAPYASSPPSPQSPHSRSSTPSPRSDDNDDNPKPIYEHYGSLEETEPTVVSFQRVIDSLDWENQRNLSGYLHHASQLERSINHEPAYYEISSEEGDEPGSRNPGSNRRVIRNDWAAWPLPASVVPRAKARRRMANWRNGESVYALLSPAKEDAANERPPAAEVLKEVIVAEFLRQTKAKLAEDGEADMMPNMDDEDAMKLLDPVINSMLVDVDKLFTALANERNDGHVEKLGLNWARRKKGHPGDPGCLSDDGSESRSSTASEGTKIYNKNYKPPQKCINTLKRDWSAVMGYAALSGDWEGGVVQRAAERCGKLLGRKMEWRTLREDDPLPGQRGRGVVDESFDREKPLDWLKIARVPRPELAQVNKFLENRKKNPSKWMLGSSDSESLDVDDSRTEQSKEPDSPRIDLEKISQESENEPGHANVNDRALLSRLPPLSGRGSPALTSPDSSASQRSATHQTLHPSSLGPADRSTPSPSTRSPGHNTASKPPVASPEREASARGALARPQHSRTGSATLEVRKPDGFSRNSSMIGSPVSAEPVEAYTEEHKRPKLTDSDNVSASKMAMVATVRERELSAPTHTHEEFRHEDVGLRDTRIDQEPGNKEPRKKKRRKKKRQSEQTTDMEIAQIDQGQAGEPVSTARGEAGTRQSDEGALKKKKKRKREKADEGLPTSIKEAHDLAAELTPREATRHKEHMSPEAEPELGVRLDTAPDGDQQKLLVEEPAKRKRRRRRPHHELHPEAD